MAFSFSLPSIASSKSPAAYPLFRGQITRSLWRVYTQRLTPAGRWLLLVSMVLVGYGGSSLQIQAYVLAAYLVAAWAIALIAAVLLRPKMDIRILLPNRVERGGILSINIELRQCRHLHGGDVSVVAFNLPATIDAVEPDGVGVPDLQFNAKHQAHLHLRFKRRGLAKVDGFRVTSSFPFGLLRSRQTFRQPREVLVYPSFAPLEQLELPIAAGHEASADLVASRLGESFEFLGNREYRQGDSPRDIDWRATARMPEPIVREWIEERQTRATLILDTLLPNSPNVDSLENFERAISLTASLGEYFSRSGIALDQLIVADKVELRGVGRRSPDFESLLDTLALTQPSVTWSNLPDSALMAAERGDVIILVLLADDELRRGWLQQLSMVSGSIRAFVVLTNPTAPALTSGLTRFLSAADFPDGSVRL